MLASQVCVSVFRLRQLIFCTSALSILGVSAVLFGCSSTTGGGQKSLARGAASEAKKAELLGAIKSLEGEWIEKKPEGTSSVTFKVSSAGSAVREIMFPGTDHEMTNMYHMDGDALVLTHFCAVGNQPRLRATQIKDNSIHFTCESVSNLATNESMYMGELILTINSPNSITETWTHFDKGEKSGGVVIELSRKN